MKILFLIFKHLAYLCSFYHSTFLTYIISVIFMSGLFLLGVSCSDAQNQVTGKQEGQIITPKEGQEVIERIDARGTISSLPEGSHLWLAVRKGSLIWPKEPEVFIAGTSWSATIYEGGTPSGGKFTLVLYIVDSKGHTEIGEWLQIGNATSSFPGLKRITGSKALHAIELRMR
jgi:hypothetical protein